MWHRTAAALRVPVGGVLATVCAATAQRDEGAGCHGATPGQIEGVKSNVDRQHLLFAIPKKGRLHDKIKELLKGSGIEYTRPERVDIAHCTNLPLSLVFLPAADIATYVGEGDVDLGITGEDIVSESEVDVAVLLKLGIGKCRLCVQAPNGEVPDVSSLAGKRIVTSFPNLARRYFSQFEKPGEPTTCIRRISGSVEASCSLGLADGIVDLVETGTTMRAAGLEAVSTIMTTETVLIANPHSQSRELVELIRRRIAGYITATKYVMVAYNIRRSDLPIAKKITPGKLSPTISPLENSGHNGDMAEWVAVSALVPRKDAASIMDALEAAGADSILLTALISSRMGD